jgi:hypothetical protein
MNSSSYQHSSLQLSQSWLGGSLPCSMPRDYRFEPRKAFYREDPTDI